MADALCGPSNALQNFQKHSQVDRTLQQDRLISRQRSVQGFRSSSGANAGLLDPEFEAFQAGHLASPPPPPQFDTRPFATSHNISHFAPPPQPQAALPDWANDFQRLHIAPAHPAAHQSSAPAVQRAPIQTSWHQDFMQTQQQPMASFHQPQPVFQAFRGTPWDYQQPTPQFASSISQGKAKMTQEQDQWSADAFAAAFEQASLDAVEPEAMYDDGLSEAMLEAEIAREIANESEAVPFMVQRPNEAEPMYEDGLSQDRLEEEIAREIEMETEEIQFLIQQKADEEAAAQAMRQETNHLSALDLSQDFLDVDEEFRIAEEHEYSDDPHPFLRLDDPMQQPIHDSPMDEQQETTASTPRSIDEELARTAGHLLESVSHDTSEKFQSSVFLQLMRRLRDREVTVEGENFVEVSEDDPLQSIQPPPESPAADGSTGDFAPTLSATPSSRMIPADEQDSDLGRFGGGGEDGRDDAEPDVAAPPPVRPLTPEFDPPAPPFEDWRKSLWGPQWVAA